MAEQGQVPFFFNTEVKMALPVFQVPIRALEIPSRRQQLRMWTLENVIKVQAKVKKGVSSFPQQQQQQEEHDETNVTHNIRQQVGDVHHGLHRYTPEFVPGSTSFLALDLLGQYLMILTEQDEKTAAMRGSVNVDRLKAFEDDLFLETQDSEKKQGILLIDVMQRLVQCCEDAISCAHADLIARGMNSTAEECRLDRQSRRGFETLKDGDRRAWLHIHEGVRRYWVFLTSQQRALALALAHESRLKKMLPVGLRGQWEALTQEQKDLALEQARIKDTRGSGQDDVVEEDD